MFYRTFYQTKIKEFVTERVLSQKRLLYWCDLFHVLYSAEMEMKSLSERFPFGKNRNRSFRKDFLFIVTPIVGVCNCSMFCCTSLFVHFSIAIILMGKRELIALLNLSSWCLVMVEQLFLTVPRGCLQFVIVVFPDHTHLLFLFYF